ncbi:uncharacterized protein TNCT_296991 [Trichonephila clavata]|uniref:Uncharacterized protein n=1 Tax=Trichonephila clavata TaxID=2740835 RepID=A0A8X6ITC7_TRICU|nr:uncharacterized protein TNCT_296991 [Trichonephila clavata]
MTGKQDSVKLKHSDWDKRLTFALSFLAMMEVDDDFPWEIPFRNEPYFYLDDSVNKRIASEQPYAVHEFPMLSQKVTVYCGFIVIHPFGDYYFNKTSNVYR